MAPKTPASKIVFDGYKPEKGIPYFPSLVSEENKGSRVIAGQDIISVMFSLCKEDSIDALNFEKLVAIGNGLSLLQESDLTPETTHFVCKAAWDCATKARDIADSTGEAEIVGMKFHGATIAAGMDFMTKSGPKCYGHHEMFFNSLIYVLMGGLGKDYAAVNDRTSQFVLYEFKTQLQAMAEMKDSQTYSVFTIVPDSGDELKYVKFTGDAGEHDLPSIRTPIVVAKQPSKKRGRLS